MPLNRDGEAMPWQFESFHDSLFGSRAHDQTIPEPIHDLMMPGIDRVQPRAGDCCEASPSEHFRCVCVVNAWQRVTLDMLMKGASKMNVEELQASADRQHGYIRLEGACQQNALERVARIVRILRLFVSGLVVQSRRDIGAAGQQNTLD